VTLYREMWRLVRCPRCYSPPGLACEDENGSRQPDLPQHQERIDEYKRRMHDA
jgi:hypothetical protein